MDNISWKEYKTNEYVAIDILKDELKLLKTVLKRKMRWLGHILRGESILKEVIEKRMEWKRERGKPRIMLLDDIKTCEMIKRRVLDRESWRNWMPRTCLRAIH